MILAGSYLPANRSGNCAKASVSATYRCIEIKLVLHSNYVLFFNTLPITSLKAKTEMIEALNVLRERRSRPSQMSKHGRAVGSLPLESCCHCFGMDTRKILLIATRTMAAVLQVPINNQLTTSIVATTTEA
jgi:hypothetical protein